MTQGPDDRSAQAGDVGDLVPGGPIGRDAELAEAIRLVEHPLDGPRGLLFEGVAGIGKTTLWRAACERSGVAGHRVLVTRPVEAETGFSYAALADLLAGDLDGAVGDLPAPQRRAIEIALLRAEAAGGSPDQHAVSLATLGVLRSIAMSGPAVVAIDDVQWIDPSSARVLGFALRRLTTEPVRILATARSGVPIPADLALALAPTAVGRVAVGPMDAKDVAAMVRQHLGADLPRPLAVRLHEVADGNPFYALEIARALARADDGWPGPADPLPVPEGLHQLLGQRIAALTPSAIELLRAVAASTRPTEELVAAAAGGDAAGGLSEAEDAGVIVRDAGTIRFTHPLLGSTVYDASPPGARRDLHVRLSGLVADPEERARHLAHAVTGPDDAVARALEEAAAHARTRGAADAAAELAELARQLTPPADGASLRRRSLAAAEYSFDAGDAARAIGLLEATIDASPPGSERAEMLFRLSSMSWMNLERGVRDPLVRALPEAEGDDPLLSGLHMGIAWVDVYQGDLRAAADHARSSLRHAPAAVAAATRADALATSAVVGFLEGRDVDDELAEAIALQDVSMAAGSWTEGSVYTTPRSVQGLRWMWAGELDAARTLLEQELAEYERVSMYTVRQEVLCYLAELECRAGRWQLAADLAAEAMETVVESGQTATQSHVVLFNQAYAAAHLGRVEEARAMATEGLRLALVNDDAFNANWNRAVLGFLALSTADAQEAHAQLAPVVDYLDRMSPAEPGVIPCLPDDIEALVLLGRPDEAEGVLERLAGRPRSKERGWARAATERCRGLIAAARGDPDAAILALDRALLEHDGDAQPFELARTLLVKGEVERRAKRRRAARESLDRAHRAFGGLGAALWRDRAASALARLGSARTPPGVLTPTEHRIAELAAEGRTNREIADAMFVSVKTVEANLSRAYHKLGIASRRELRGAAELGPSGAGADPSDRHP